MLLEASDEQLQLQCMRIKNILLVHKLKERPSEEPESNMTPHLITQAHQVDSLHSETAYTDCTPIYH
jgi:hypothetical protein